MQDRLASLYASPRTFLGTVLLTQSVSVTSLDHGLGVLAHVTGTLFLIPAFQAWWRQHRPWACVAAAIWLLYTVGFYLRLFFPNSLDAFYSSLPLALSRAFRYGEALLRHTPVWIWFAILLFLWIVDRYRYLPLPGFGIERRQRLRAAFMGWVPQRSPDRTMEQEVSSMTKESSTIVATSVQEGITVEPYIMQGALAHEARVAVVSWDNQRHIVVARAKVRLVAGETIEAKEYSGAQSLLWMEPEQGMEGTLVYGQRAEFAFAVVGFSSSLNQQGIAFRVKVWEHDSEQDALIVRWTVGQFAPARVEVDIALIDATSDAVYRLDRYSLYGDESGGCRFEHVESLPPQLARVLSAPNV